MKKPSFKRGEIIVLATDHLRFGTVRELVTYPDSAEISYLIEFEDCLVVYKEKEIDKADANAPTYFRCTKSENG